MGSSEDSNWVFDSLVGFLQGPVWNYPILTFIEQKSLIFDPEEQNDECETEYKKTHEDYKHIVDYMLRSYMEDLEISTEQFESACGKSSKKIKTKFHLALFEQVWAANDFEIFKRMMIQKNIELQLQALELLQHRYGVSLKPEEKAEDQPPKKNKKNRESESEQSVMDKIKEQSLTEHKEMLEEMDNERKELEEALARSMDDQRRLENQQKNQTNILAEQFMKSASIEDSTTARSIMGATNSPSPEVPKEPEVSAEDIAKRTAFLKAQRDKLLAMKKAEREKQLSEVEKSQVKMRPKSARAARSVIGGSRSSINMDSETLKIRRALAEKLKNEVIDKDFE